MGRERLGVKVGRGRAVSEPEAIPEMGRVPRNGTGAQFEKPEIYPESNTPFAFPPEPAMTWAFFRFLFAKVFAQKNLGLGFWFLRHVGRGRYGHLRDML